MGREISKTIIACPTDKMRNGGPSAHPNKFMFIDIGDTSNEYKHKFKFKSENH